MLKVTPLAQMILDAQTNFENNADALGDSSDYVKLMEFRVIMYSTGRQTGNTARVAEIFDAESDIYISQMNQLNEIFKDQIGSDCRTLSLRSKSFMDSYEKLLDGPVKRVFIDVGPWVFMCYRNKIHHFLQAFDELLGQKENPIYIIT